jgi:glycosyltransferase involved in cell wall biosynthesis
MVKFTVVMPIHNDEDMLRYSLPSIYRLQPDEIILLLDRCTDESYETAVKIAKYYDYEQRTRFVKIHTRRGEWKFQVAYLRRYGFKLAKNAIILNTDADMILDEKILDYLSLIGKNNVGIILFGFKIYPLTLRSFIGSLVSLLAPIGFGFGNTYAFLKRAWMESEDQEAVKKIHRIEDTFLYSSIAKNFEILFIKTNTVNLRFRESKKVHFSKGVNRWKQERVSLLHALIHSFIYLRPFVLLGYLKARFHNYDENKHVF